MYLQKLMESPTYDLTSTTRKCAFKQIKVASLKVHHLDKSGFRDKGKKRPGEVGLTAWGAPLGQTATSSTARMMKLSLSPFDPSGGRGCGCRWNGQVDAARATC